MKKAGERIKQIIHYFFPTKEIRWLGIVLVFISSVLIFAPPLSGTTPYFDASNYYDLISGIIGGLITVYVLLMQFTNENEKKHEEERVNARGYFEINYANKLDEKLKKCVAKTDVTRIRNSSAHNYLILRLHGDKCIFDCHIKLNIVCSDERFTREDLALIGLVVPNQTIAIPMVISDNNTELLKYTNKINILYRTTMKEVIKHCLVFEDGITNPANSEVMYCKQGNNPINRSTIDKTISDANYEIVFESQSTLFEYSGMV